MGDLVFDAARYPLQIGRSLFDEATELAVRCPLIVPTKWALP